MVVEIFLLKMLYFGILTDEFSNYFVYLTGKEDLSETAGICNYSKFIIPGFCRKVSFPGNFDLSELCCV